MNTDHEHDPAPPLVRRGGLWGYLDVERGGRFVPAIAGGAIARGAKAQSKSDDDDGDDEGGDDDDDDEGGGAEGDEGGGGDDVDDDDGGEGDASESQSDDDDDDDVRDGDDRPLTGAEAAKLRRQTRVANKEAARNRKAQERAEAEAAKLRKRNETETQRQVREAREQADEKARSEERPKAAAVAARAALLEAGVAPASIPRLVRSMDLGSVEVDDDGEATGLDDQIEDLREEMPALFAKRKDGDETPRVRRRRREATPGADGGTRPPAGAAPKSSAQKLAAQIGA